MRLHIDLLGWLHAVWGAFGVLTGVSLLVLAIGTRVTAGDAGRVADSAHAAAVLLAACGTLFALGGVIFIVVGSLLRRRRQRGRLAALVLGGPNLVLVPFGTALGIYTFWVLLNDDARREFGRPPRAPLAGPRLEGA